MEIQGRKLILASGLILLCGLSVDAHASSRRAWVRLSYDVEATPELGCLDREGFESELAIRLGASPVSAQAPREAQVVVRFEADTVRGSLRVVGQGLAGEASQAQAEDRGPEACATVLRALASHLALALDALPDSERTVLVQPAPGEAKVEPAPPPPPKAPPSPQDASTVSESLFLAAGVGPSQRVGRTQTPTQSLSPRLWVDVSLGAGARPALGATFQAGGGFQSGGFFGALAVGLDLPSTHSSANGGFSAQRGYLRGLACRGMSGVLLCAQGLVGKMWVAGFEVENARSASATIASVGPHARFFLPTASQARFFLSTSADFALAGAEVRVGQSVVWARPLVSAEVGFGIEFLL